MQRQFFLVPLLLILAACGSVRTPPPLAVDSPSQSSVAPTPSATLLVGVDAYASALLRSSELPKPMRKLKGAPDASDKGKFLLPVCGGNGRTAITDGAFRQFGSGNPPTAFVDVAGFTASEAEAAMVEISDRARNCTKSYQFQRFYRVLRTPKVSQLPGIDDLILVHGRSDRTISGTPAVDRYEMVFRRGQYLGTLILVVAPKTVSDRQWAATIKTFAAKVAATTG